MQKKADEHVQFISKEGLECILYIEKHGLSLLNELKLIKFKMAYLNPAKHLKNIEA